MCDYRNSISYCMCKPINYNSYHYLEPQTNNEQVSDWVGQWETSFLTLKRMRHQWGLHSVVGRNSPTHSITLSRAHNTGPPPLHHTTHHETFLQLATAAHHFEMDHLIILKFCVSQVMLCYACIPNFIDADSRNTKDFRTYLHKTFFSYFDPEEKYFEVFIRALQTLCNVFVN